MTGESTLNHPAYHPSPTELRLEEAEKRAQTWADLALRATDLALERVVVGVPRLAPGLAGRCALDAIRSLANSGALQPGVDIEGLAEALIEWFPGGARWRVLSYEEDAPGV